MTLARDNVEAMDVDAGGPDGRHQVPSGVSRATVEALGKLSEVLETTDRARGCLYEFHQLTGHADLMLDDALCLFRDAGHPEVAERLDAEVVGRNVITGRWTFQIVEDYDDNYWSMLRAHEQQARDELAGGRRHLHEAAMKEERRSSGRRHHEATPDDVDPAV